MFQDGEYYYAVAKNKDMKNPDNWEVVQYKDRSFLKIRNLLKYKLEDFERVTTTSIRGYISTAQSFKRSLVNPDKTKASVKINLSTENPELNRILKELGTLKDDFEGNISLTDPDRDSRIQTIYRLYDKLLSKDPD